MIYHEVERFSNLDKNPLL